MLMLSPTVTWAGARRVSAMITVPMSQTACVLMALHTFSPISKLFDFGVRAQSLVQSGAELLAHLLLQLLAQSIFHRFKFLRSRRVVGVEPDDGVAVLDRNQAAQLPWLQGLRGLQYFRRQLGPVDRPAIAHHYAIVVFRNFFCQHAELFVILRGLRLPQRIFRAHARFLQLAGCCFRWRQNRNRLDGIRFRYTELFEVLVVVRFRLYQGDRCPA